MRRAGLAVVLVVGLASPVESEGQRRPTSTVGRATTLPEVPSPRQSSEAGLAPAALSLVVPGAGQHVLGQRRKWAYLALEVAGWAFFVERRSAGSDYRNRYRELPFIGELAEG